MFIRVLAIIFLRKATVIVPEHPSVIEAKGMFMWPVEDIHSVFVNAERDSKYSLKIMSVKNELNVILCTNLQT